MKKYLNTLLLCGLPLFLTAQSIKPDSVFTPKEQIPEYIGGQSALFKLISKNYQIPEINNKQAIDTNLIAQFVVDTLGKLEALRIIKGFLPATDEEFLRVIKLTNGKWKPGMQEGIKVKVLMNLPLHLIVPAAAGNSKKVRNSKIAGQIVGALIGAPLGYYLGYKLSKSLFQN